MITVYIPDNFVPERTYAITTLLTHYCRIDINIETRKGQVHYELKWENRSIIIKDQFFGKTFVGETYLSHARIPEKIKEAISPGFDNIICIYGEDVIEIGPDKIVSDIDLFAGAFFMLTRWEESFGLYEDLHGRFPADKALIVKNGFILRPVVDEYVAVLKKWLFELGYHVPADHFKFKVVPTCDVDIPYYWRSRHPFRLLAGRMIKHKALRQVVPDLRTMQETKKGIKKDPYDTFEYLMTLAEERSLKIIFHIIAGGESKFEGYYDIQQKHIRILIDGFKKRGHVVGLHPSYNAFIDPKKISRERAHLERISGETISVSRQHYLRFAVPETWRYLQDAYIKEDSTVGYAAEPGFRCGTSKPFSVFDIHQRKQLTLIERPLLIMDVSLKLYKNFSIEESKAYCETIIDQVKKHKGELVFLWHNSSLSEMDGWDGWNEVPEILMDSGKNE